MRTESVDLRRETLDTVDVSPSTDALSPPDLALQMRVVQRQGWERGEPVTVEQLLAKHPKIAEDPESVLDLIYHEFLLHERYAGRLELEAFVARFPEHEAALRMQIAFHRAVEADSPDQAAPPAANGPAEVTDGAAAEGETIVPAIRGYEVLDQIGFGGMGVVYRARQVETNRIVALKVLSAGAHAGAAQRARFRAEAELIARLQHPNIVQIYEAGERQGCPFLVLEYIGGGSLRDRLQGVPHAPRIAAQYVEVVARALEAAHVAGVVHRDLTPGNILFTSATDAAVKSPGIDVGIPKISDFGLAKSLRADGEGGGEQRTLSGDVMGTPAYMSPEQAAGRTREIGPASDIYSLGAILYELLTGRPPFRAVTAVETLQLVVTAEPVSASRLQSGLPRDIETICLKCLQKQPAQRYSSASDLADDLQRFLAGETIRARPVGHLAKFARWCRRKPLLASLVSLVGLLVVILVAGSMAAAVRLNQAALDRLAEAKLAEARVHRLDNQLGRGDKSLAALAEAARIRATPEVRDEAIASVALFDLKFSRFGPSIGPGEAFVDFDPNLRCYATSDAEGNLIIRRVADEMEICRLRQRYTNAGIIFSPDGRHVACRSPDDLKVEVWFVDASEPRLVVAADCDQHSAMRAVNFSVDGRHAAIGRSDGLVRVFGLEDGIQTAEMHVAGPINHLAFHPRLPQLAIAGRECLEIRGSEDGRLLVQLDEAAESESLAWHPQGQLLATADRDDAISLWEPARLRRRAVLRGHSSGGVKPVFNHSGTLLFSTAWDGSLRVWDPHWGKALFQTIGSDRYLLRFSADDRLWAGDVVEGRIRTWNLPDAPAYRRLTPESAFELGYYRTPAISPAGSARGRLLAVGMEHGVGFWDLRSGRPVGHLPIGLTGDLVFDSAGNLLTADPYKTLLWPVRESPEATEHLIIGPPERLGSPGTLSQMACSANGRIVGLSRREQGGLVIDRDHPEAPVALAPHVDVRSIALTPDGTMAATGSHNGGLVKIWDARSGTLIRDLALKSSRVAFSPDGRQLLTTANGLELWSVGDWQALWKGAGGALSANAFSPDGRLVAVDAGTGRIILYAADDGRIVARLNDPYPSALHALAIAPDGLSVVGISRDLHQLFVWDMNAVARSLADVGIDSEILSKATGSPNVASLDSLSLAIRLNDPDAQILDDLAQCQNELQSRPGDAGLQLRLGRLLSQLGRDGEARDAFQASIEGSGSVDASIELAVCEVRLEHWAQGLAILQRALANPSLSPGQTALLCNNLAWTLSLAPPEFRNPSQAVEFAHRALELEPANLNYFNTLGLALCRQGELPLAIETLKLSLRGSSMPIFDLYVLALCYQSAGNLRSAADHAARANYLFEAQEKTWNRHARMELQQLREEYARGLKPRNE